MQVYFLRLRYLYVFILLKMFSVLFFRTLNFNGNPMFVGGLMSADPILERPGQVHSDDFVGCVHSVAVNGRPLNLTSPLRSRGIDPTCSRSSRSLCSGIASNLIPDSSEMASPIQLPVCGLYGTCYDRWNSVSCVCDGSDLVSPNCNDGLEPMTLTDGGFIEFKISETHRRMQLLDNLYKGSTLWFPHHDRLRRSINSSLGSNSAAAQPPKSISVMFRTLRRDGIIFFSATNKDFTSVEVNAEKANSFMSISLVIRLCLPF